MKYMIDNQNITIELDSKFYDIDDIKSTYNLIKDECTLTIGGGGNLFLK